MARPRVNMEVAPEPARDFNEINKRLAFTWRERRDALGLTGKKADDAALEFAVGAAVGAALAGDRELHNHLTMMVVMVVRVRGDLGLATLCFDPVP